MLRKKNTNNLNFNLKNYLFVVYFKTTKMLIFEVFLSHFCWKSLCSCLYLLPGNICAYWLRKIEIHNLIAFPLCYNCFCLHDIPFQNPSHLRVFYNLKKLSSFILIKLIWYKAINNCPKCSVYSLNVSLVSLEKPH